MRTATKRALGIVAAAAIVTASASAVFAHGGGAAQGSWGGHGGMMGGTGMMRGMGMMGGPAMRGGWGAMGAQGDWNAALDSRLGALREALGITGEQEAAWQGFADAARGKAAFMQEHHRAGPSFGSFEEHAGRMQAGASQMATLAGAATRLYETLSPEQRAKADSLLGPHFFR